MQNKSAPFSSPVLYVYGVRIQLKENSRRLDGNEIVLSSEMTIKAEVKTNKRRVAFFPNPIKSTHGRMLEGAVVR